MSRISNISKVVYFACKTNKEWKRRKGGEGGGVQESEAIKKNGVTEKKRVYLLISSWRPNEIR